VFPKIRVPENGWFTMENPIEMDDLGGTTIFGNTHIENKTCHLLELGKIFKKSSDSLLCVLFLSGPTF